MKIVCDGLDLSEAILKVSRGISNKTTNPILEGIKLTAEEDYLTLSATDLELSIEKTIKAQVMMEGETVVPGKLFSEFIKKLNNEQIELELDTKNILSVIYTDSCGKIQCLKTDEFPQIKHQEYETYFEMKQNELKNLINRSVYAVAVDETRPILKGCKIEIENKEITAVALDGYRLALCKKKLVNATNDMSFIVPARTLREIAGLLEDSEETVKIYVSANNIMMELDNVKITSRLLEGEFINYKQIIPTNFTSSVIINKEQLENAIERASLLSKVERNNLIKFDINEKVMVLTGRSEITDFKEKITVSLKGNDINIGFNARYFIEALRTLSDEFIKLNFTSPIAPCIITSNESDEYLYLILPVRMM